MHGLLAGVAGWEVEHHEPRGDGARLAGRFDLAAHPDLLAAFPFPHELLFDAPPGRADAPRSRRPSSRRATLPVPIAFGYHPYFVLPGVAAGRMGDRRSP